MRLVLVSVLLLFLVACTGTMTGKPLDKTTAQTDSSKQTGERQQTADADRSSAGGETAKMDTTPSDTTSEPATETTTQNADSITVPIEGAGTCEDSDGGPNTKVSGRTTVTSKTGGKETRTDECNDVILTEYYCADDGFGSINKKCSDSCENGACV
jgi:hypothetical protein